MKEKVKNLKKYRIRSYKEFNITIVVLSFMMIFLPVIVYFIRLIFPNMVRCLYYEITSKPCPFCGFTTDLRNMLKGKIFVYKYNILSVPLVVIAIIEIISRIMLFKSKIWESELKVNSIIKSDILIHITLFIIVLVYIIFYFKLDLRRF